MSSKQFKTTQDTIDNKKTSSNLTRVKKQKEIKEKELASIIAFILFFGGIVLGVGIYSINYYNDYVEELRMANVEEGMFYLPGEVYVHESEIETYLSGLIDGNSYPLEYKLEIMEYLHKQDYEKVDDYMNIINELYNTTYVIDDNTDIVLNMTNKDNLGTINGNLATKEQISDTVEFLKSEGLLDSEFELSESTETDGGITGINTKEAISYRNLHEAEVGYGTKLGLYMYVDALKNYEMINAYTIGEEFMQCVYAINQDGTKITKESLADEKNIRTITVKLSTTKKSDELKKVYKEYPTLKSLPTNYGTIQFCGNELDLVNLIYVDRNDGRTYVIHTADGIDMTTSTNLVGELFANIEAFSTRTGEKDE